MVIMIVIQCLSETKSYKKPFLAAQRNLYKFNCGAKPFIVVESKNSIALKGKTTFEAPQTVKQKHATLIKSFFSTFQSCFWMEVARHQSNNRPAKTCKKNSEYFSFQRVKFSKTLFTTCHFLN